MNKRELKNQNALLKMRIDWLQQQSFTSKGIFDVNAEEQSSETGTLAKKRLESNRISSERSQSEDYMEMKRELMFKQQQKEIKSLYKKVRELEKREEKLQTQFEREVIEKGDCIRNLEKKVKKQGDAIKQIEAIFLAVAISKKYIAPGTSFKKMVKKCSQKSEEDVISLIGNERGDAWNE